MWSSLGDRLAGLGDSITERASAHAKRQHEQQQGRAAADTSGPTDSSGSSGSSGSTGTVVKLPPLPSSSDAPTAANATESSRAEKEEPEQQAVGVSSRWTNGLAAATASFADKQNQQAMLGSFRNWTGSVMEATRHVVDATREAVEKEQQRLHATAPSLFPGKGPHRRDPKLPLDVESLRDADLVYITDRIVTLSHPFQQSTINGDITPERKLAAVAHLLQKRHGGRYMVWNLSELEYDATILDDQVLVFKFPGSPSPPLGLLLKLLLSVESWLKADRRNVAVMHCLTGRGRTSTVLAAFLCWTGEAGFSDVNVALEYIAACKQIPTASLTIPSQVRYVSYFANMLDGVRPSQPPLMLKRIIMSEAPKFAKRTAPSNNAEAKEDVTGEALSGCAPYLQIFKAGKLVLTTAASVNFAQSKDELPFCTVSDGPVSFHTEAVVQGDILLRCRHLSRSGQRLSMFRCAFHTGYVPPKVLRLTKAQLDGANCDKRFSDDFFLDLIFEACDEATASQHLMTNPQGNNDNSGEKGGASEDVANEAVKRRAMGAVGSSSNAISASAYDTMLHRDSRFWDVIAERREEHMKKMAELEKTGAKESLDEKEANVSLSGPTIGRRRDFAALGQSSMADSKTPDEGQDNSKSKTTSPNKAFSAFSIGGDFDFVNESSSESNTANTTIKTVTSPPSPPSKPKRDALMEALMGLEDDGVDDDDDDFTPAPAPLPMTEDLEGEIVFESGSSMDTPEMASTPIQPSDAINTSKSIDLGESDVVLPEDKTAAKGTDSTSEAGTPTKPLENNNLHVDASKLDDDLLPTLAGIEDDLADLAVMDNADDLDLGDGGEFDGLDDLEDDPELEDLENFLTQVSSKN